MIEEVTSKGQEGLFTSCYVECGILGAKAPTFTHYYGCDKASVFDLASLSKGLVLGPLVYQLLDLMSLSSLCKVSDVLPSADLPMAVKNIVIKDLLSHESGLPAWRNFWVNRLDSKTSFAEFSATADSHIEKVFSRFEGLTFQPGKDLYSDVGMILLGYLVQKASGQSLEELFMDLLAPFDQKGFMGGPKGLLGVAKEDVVRTAYCPIRRRELQGEVHDENCAALGGFTGHAGLFSTGPRLGGVLRDYAKSRVLSGYFSENERLLRETKKTGLFGLRRGDDIGSLPFGQGMAMGHLGFTGTAFWVWPEKGFYGVLLTNRVVSGRVSPKIQPFRGKVFGYLGGYLG